MIARPYTIARILIATGTIEKYYIGQWMNFVQANRAARQFADKLADKTLFNVSVVEVTKE